MPTVSSSHFGRLLLLLALLFGSLLSAVAQVGIGTTAPNARAALDIVASDKGLLLPRLTAAQRGAIAAPVPAGLLVYQTDGAQPGFWYYAASGGWTFLNPTNDNLGNHMATTNVGLNDNWLSNAHGSANGLRVDNTGNVGIGTAAPGQRLHVAGNIAASGPLGVLLDQQDRPLITRGWNPFTSGSYAGAGRWGLFMESDRLTFGVPALANKRFEWVTYADNSTVGATLMTLSQTGTLGLGTTTPATTLDIRAADAAITVGTTAGGLGALYLGNTNHGVKRGYANGNDVGLYTTSGNVYLSANGTSTSQFALLNGGNVGIGTATPGQKLEVNGTALINTNYDLLLRDANAGLGWYGATGGSKVFANVTGFDGTVLYGYNGGMLGTKNGGNRTALYWNMSGSVGIGTTAPAASAALDVSSTTKGFLAPRLTQTERDAIGSPAQGLLIYNTTTNRLNTWNGAYWEAGVVAAEQPGPAAPTVTLGYTGGVQTYTVPTGVFRVTLDVRGAQGGASNNGGAGGMGGRMVASLGVTPGETLLIYVGGAGTTAPINNVGGAGYNGGGETFRGGGGGGGASDVRRGPALTDRIVIAAGGGGGARANDPKTGGAGGYPNGGDGDGIFGPNANGDGATQTGPGAGGAPSLPAGLGQGAGTGIEGAGGGGGGYYGGGAGGWYINVGLPGSGGGGSSHVKGNATLLTAETGTVAGNGSVIITPNATYAAPILNGANFTSVASTNGLLARGHEVIDVQGAHLQWNRTNGEGETWLLNQRGGGNSNAGIRFGKSDQTNSVSEWARFNDDGRFGIGTTNPIAPLHVKGANINSLANGSASFFNQGGGFNAIGNMTGNKATTAYFEGGEVWVSGFIVAGNLNTTSDRRIKRIVGLSDRATDLTLLNRIRITDYTYIDQLNNTPGVVKKVIAQEVEEVLPTAVSRSFQALPNVYERATRVTYANGFVTVTTAKPHELPATGGRLRLYTPANQGLDPEVTIVDAHTVRFASPEAHADGLFVYGKYVDDFRSVDYDALTTLNVSATQELARKVAALEAQNAALRQQTQTQGTRLDEQHTALQTLQAQMARLLGEAPSATQARK